MSDNIYAMAEDNFQTQLWKRLLKKGTVKQTASRLKLSSRQLYRWKEGEACYPLSALIKLCDLAKLKPRFAFIRTRRDSEALYQPKVETKLNKEFTEFLGHLLHDGGIDKDWRVHYTSDEQPLLNRFQRLVEACFGYTRVKSRPSGAATTIYYPAILGFLLRNLGLPKGSKVESNVSIPKEIKAKLTTRNLIVPYVVLAFRCDGESGRARIALASRDVAKPSKLLRDLEDMLRRLGYKSLRIVPSMVYETKQGPHRRWVLSLEDKQEKQSLLKMIQDYSSANLLDLQS